MQVRREAVGAIDQQTEHVGGAVHRLERADAHADIAGHGRQSGKQVAERLASGEVAAPPAEMDAGERDFLVARVDSSRELVDDGGQRPAAARPTRRRDDAVAARLVAAGLGAQRPRRAAHQPGPGHPAARPLAHIHVGPEDRQQPWLVVVGHDFGHAGRSATSSPHRDA